MNTVKDIALKFHVETLVTLLIFIVGATWVVGNAFSRTNYKIDTLEVKYDHAMKFAMDNEERISDTQLAFATTNRELVMELRGIRESIVKINTILEIKEEV